MQQPENSFRTNKYHRNFGLKNIHPLRQTVLRTSYRTSRGFIKRLGWSEPLARKDLRILLCGTASPYTTVAFVRFVRSQNAMASIDILDISAYTLQQSKRFLKTCPDIESKNISFVEGDALNMPYTDEYFDWIETDFFLQYFSPSARNTLFEEWQRVLKPGGIVTTRDWLRQKDDLGERVVEHSKNWLIKHVLGPTARSARLLEVKSALRALNLEVAFFPMKIPVLRIGLPMINYILIYKPSTNLPAK